MRSAFLFLAICLLAFAGCKKNNTTSIPKIKTTIIPDVLNSTVDTLDYYYNSDGKVVQIKNHNGSSQAFVYTAISVHHWFYDENNIEVRSMSYHLNSAGLADSAYETFGGSTAYYYSYRYDDKGFITTRKFYDPSNALSSVTTWANDGSNTTDESVADKNGTVTSTTHYTFFTDHNNTIGNDNMGMPFLGKRYSNPIKSQSVSGSLSYVNTFTYTYDSEGRITSMSAYSGTGSLSYTNEYSYE